MKRLALSLLFCAFFTSNYSKANAQTYVRGNLDSVSGLRVVVGWSFETTYPTTSINVDMYIDGTWVARVPANIYRSDVNSAYGISGNHGFSWSIPAIYNDNNTHTLDIYGISVDNTPNPLLTGCPFGFSNDKPLGNLDGINSTNAHIGGWAFDQDQGSYSIWVAFYMDNGAGVGGRFIGSNLTDIYRPDVNSAYSYLGVTGNHGFSWTLPSQYQNAYHVIYPYAIDSYETEGIGSGVNPLLSSAPQAYGTKPDGDATISSTAAGEPLSLQTSDWAAGAVTSLTWNGIQFVDSEDHGRELQSAISFYQNFESAEDFNPTEAGSENDGSSGNASTSVLQAISVGATPPSISTQTQMAYWESFSSPCETCASVPLSEIVLNKTVSLGYNGYNNIISDTVTFDVPKPDEYPYGYSEYQDGQFEALTGYMPTSFTTGESYSPTVGTFTNISLSEISSFQYPIIFEQSSGLAALGVFCPDLFPDWALYPKPAFGTPDYGVFNFAVPKWNVFFRYTNGVPPAQYTFHFCMPIGTAASVRTALSALYRQEDPNFAFESIWDWWKGESNATDSAGSNNGTPSNITYAQGCLGYAFDFNGTSSLIDFGANAGNFGTNDFMIDFWINTSRTSSEQSIIGKRPTCGLCNMWDVRMQSGGEVSVALCQDTSGTGYITLESSRSINDGNFHEVAIKRSGLTLSIYVDGLLDNSTTAPAVANLGNTTDLVAGKSACVGHDATVWFQGLLDEIRIGTVEP